MRRLAKCFSVVLLTLMLLGLYAFWWEPSRIRVVEYDVMAGSGGLTQPLRIAVIADLHAGARYIDEGKIDRVVSLTMARAPDLILLAGDYVVGTDDKQRIPFEVLGRKLKTLSAPLGVFAVIGNHDRWSDPERITNILEAAGIRVLEDRSIPIASGGHSFYLVGLSDFFTVVPNVARALADVPEDAHAICFTHSPDVFPELPATCALTIAGHTHGGQVWLPFLGRPIVPSRYGQRYAAGLIHENDKVLFVSTGIGTSILPVRFGVVPEISILNVR